MGKQALKVELFYGGAWVDVSSKVLVDTPVTITRGDSDDSPSIRPATAVLRFKNQDDLMRTTNPVSPLYGKAGINTPIRISVGSAARFYGECKSFSADQTDDFRKSPLRGNAWVDVQAGGLLQRVLGWTRSVKSPMRLFDDGLSNVIGRWRMEDPAGSLVASSDVTGAQNVALFGHSFGSQNSPPGGGTAVDAGSKPFAQFVFAAGDPQSTAGWQISKLIYIDRLTGGGILDPVLACNVLDGQGSRIFQLNGDTNEITLHGSNAAGGVLFDQTFSSGGYTWTGKWIMFQFQASYSSGTTTIGASWRAIGDASFLGVSTTYSGVTSQPYYSVAAVLPGCSYGHFVAVKGFTDDLTSDARFDAFSGHPGERASYRIDRLCNENGIPHFVGPAFDSSQKMGPQGADTIQNLFQVIKSTDDGLIFDLVNDLKIMYWSMADRFNQSPALTLDAASVGSHGMPSLPAEVTGADPVHNIVTAKQADGGEVTARDDTTVLGTQDPPDGVGEERFDVDVNVYNPALQLVQEAHWWLNRGTVNLPRFPTVTIDVTRLSAPRLAAVEAVDVGKVIEIVNYRENTIRLYVLGYKEIIGTHTRTLVFTCMPDQQFDVGVLNTNHLQARFTIVFPALDATSTTLTLFNGEPTEQWRPGVSGVHIMLGGEEIILGTIGARSGSNPYSWTVTGCTRSVNGVVKSHTITEFVRVKDPIRLTMGDPA
jgi:hypothetical protein